MCIPALHVQTPWKAESGGGTDGKSSICQVLFTKYLPCCSLTCLTQGDQDGIMVLVRDTPPYPGSCAWGGLTGVKCGFEDH